MSDGLSASDFFCGSASRQSERRTFRFGFFFCGSALRLSERQTSIFGLTSMSFVSTLASRFLRYFWQRSDICAILFQSDILAHIVFIPSGFEQPSRQGFFLLIFPSFFEKRRFWRAMPGGHQRVVPTAPGSLFPKKKFSNS